MTAEAAYHSNLQRGRLLRENGRYAEARPFLGHAIQANPDKPEPYLEIALLEGDLDRKAPALEAMDRAVALAPNSAYYVGFKGYLLSQLGRHKEALDVAAVALQIDPASHVALLARANAYTKLNRWVEAELAARRMLELNAEDMAALNLFAQSLRLQGRLPESRKVIAQILALTPNDAFGHANAGYEALKAGDHLRANRHFLESLRIRPNDDFARRGLLQSLRARMFVYRYGFNLVTTTSDLGRGGRIAFVILNIATGGLIFGLLVVYLAFALTLQPLSNFFLLFHRTGRHALNRRERSWAAVTGVVACGLLLTAAIFKLSGLVVFVGAYLSLFALSVYLPQWVDAWRHRREEKLVTASARG